LEIEREASETFRRRYGAGRREEMANPKVQHKVRFDKSGRVKPEGSLKYLVTVEYDPPPPPLEAAKCPWPPPVVEVALRFEIDAEGRLTVTPKAPARPGVSGQPGASTRPPQVEH
jgi:hypothetical protein